MNQFSQFAGKPMTGRMPTVQTQRMQPVADNHPYHPSTQVRRENRKIQALQQFRSTFAPGREF